ncbi:hypothetical protein TURU_030800 [Turdus rufiventris]|nr:hypothetical protein TURU_030800 [Turdus rufiventris]
MLPERQQRQFRCSGASFPRLAQGQDRRPWGFTVLEFESPEVTNQVQEAMDGCPSVPLGHRAEARWLL